MTDAPFTETHRKTLTRWDTYAIRNDWHTLGNAIDAAFVEIDRLTLLVQACGNTECIAKAKYDATLQQMKLYGRELDDWAEKEASCCPEDVSFVDRIKWLEGEIDRLTKERDGFQHTLRQANIQIDRLTAQEIDRLRTELGYFNIVALRQESARLREALQTLRNDANRLCDRQLGGTYEDDCRRSIAKADDVLR